MDSNMLAALWLTAKLALLTSFLLLLLGYPLAWWLARGRAWWLPLLRVVVNLPLILPPTVLGYYLLLAFGKNGLDIAFSFQGLLIGSLLYSMPFAVGPYLSALERLEGHYEEAARALGLSSWQTLRYVVWPLTWGGVVSGCTMSFAHTVGEFGVVLLIGGNIPQQTQTASIYLFELIQALEYQQAAQLAGVLLIFSIVVLLMLQYWSIQKS